MFQFCRWDLGFVPNEKGFLITKEPLRVGSVRKSFQIGPKTTTAITTIDICNRIRSKTTRSHLISLVLDQFF